MNFYELLGVDRSAGAEDIKKAFRKKAQETHPDKHPDDKDAANRFSAINSAYQVLGDAEKRKKYDLELDATILGSDTARNWARNAVAQDLQDLLEETMNRVRTQSQNTSFTSQNVHSFYQDLLDDEPEPKHGEDFNMEVVISLAEAVQGCEKSSSYTYPAHRVPCDSCEGVGIPKTARKFPCMACGGKGRKPNFQVGIGPRLAACPACRGSGSSSREKCNPCKGTGKKPFKRELKLRIPSGVQTGQTLRFAGGGIPGVGHPPGDLFVKVRVMDDGAFTRKGQDLFVSCIVTLSQALRGDLVEVPCIDGRSIQVGIPRPLRPGSPIRIEGEGVKGITSHGRGDLYVEFQIALPTKMTPRAQKLSEELAEELELAAKLHNLGAGDKS